MVRIKCGRTQLVNSFTWLIILLLIKTLKDMQEEARKSAKAFVQYLKWEEPIKS